MKIRNDFVTNSSSTSFIISLKEELDKENFMQAVGANGNSPLNKLFEDLFDAVNNNIEDITVAAKKSEDGSIKSFLAGTFSDDTIEKVEALLGEGRKVYYGRLHSDGDSAVEQYFCCESFIICEDEIYFNGNIGGW